MTGLMIDHTAQTAVYDWSIDEIIHDVQNDVYEVGKSAFLIYCIIRLFSSFLSDHILNIDSFSFYTRSLQRKVFRAWRRLPQELRREAQREKLRLEMRKKVADLLPDFKPSVSVTQSTDSIT